MNTILDTESTLGDAARLRAVLGRFCTGVTVITAQELGTPLGFTCQAFSALSLNPPYVCCFPGRTSTTWPRIRDTSRFCVNILAADQEDICHSFAVSGPNKFTGVRWNESPNGSPLLHGVIAWIDCLLEREVDGGDHTIAIARITNLSAPRDTSPLLFYRSTFNQIATDYPGDFT